MKTVRKIRFAVQLFFFLLIAAIIIQHSLEEAGKQSIPFLASASSHAICPFGGVVSLGQLIHEGSLLPKIHESSIVLMIAVGITALLFGAAFCAWVCPFGFFQELIAPLGQKLWKKRYNRFIPAHIDRGLRYIRYAILLWVLYISFASVRLVFADYDPYYALFNFWTGEVASTAFIALAAVIIASFFIERPFCKYACPYGALLGLSNLIRIVPLRRNTTSCISCKACDRVCPMNINVSTRRSVRDHQCIHCLACSSEAACPVPATLTTLRSPYLATLILLIMAGTIFFSISISYWKTEGGKTPSLISEGPFEGFPDPGDIRGSYSFSDIEAGFDVPVEALATAFSFITSDNPEAIQPKSFEAYPQALDSEIGTDSIRLFVSLYTGIPYQAEEDTKLPITAIDVLADADKLTGAKESFYENYGVKLSEADEIQNGEKTTPMMEIKGRTSFQELYAAGLSRETIKTIIGIEPGPDSSSVKEYLEGRGYEFSTYKESLEKAVHDAESP